MIGIVPARVAAAGSAGGVEVDWVWPDGPAARAGLVRGDLVTAVADEGGEPQPVDSPTLLAGFIGGLEAGRTATLVVRRDGAERTVAVDVAPLPALVPAGVANPPAASGPPTVERLEAAEVARPPLAVLPGGKAGPPLGVLVYFGPPPGPGDGAAARQAAEPWLDAAARHGVAVVLPTAADPQRWGRDDVAAVARGLDALRARRPVDPRRVAVAGRGPGGACAWLVAEALGPAVGGAALLDAALPRQATVEPTEPGRSLWVLFGGSLTGAPAKAAADRALLGDRGYQVGLLPDVLGDAPPAEELCRWVESLGVL